MDNANFERNQKNFFKKVERKYRIKWIDPGNGCLLSSGQVYGKRRKDTGDAMVCIYYRDQKEEKLNCTRS